MGESKRNILDENTGFNVRVNLYIIRYMYSHMMNKADLFWDTSGQRKKAKDFYGIIRMSKQRFNRIMNAENFEMSAKDIKYLKELFNISEEYFSGSGKFLEVQGIREEDWKKYMKTTYTLKNDCKSLTSTEYAIHNKVKRALTSLYKDSMVYRDYNGSMAIYRIYHFWKTGVTYSEDSKRKRFVEALANLKVEDWEEIENDVESMERYRKQLLEHAEYLKIILDYKKLKNK